MKNLGALHLWEVNENVERLDIEKVKIFHSLAAKMLYVMKRTRPDIEPEVAYFTTQVANSNMYYWNKMRRCPTFIKQSKQEKRIIGCFNLKDCFTWVDALFAVYQNMLSHTDGAISM